MVENRLVEGKKIFIIGFQMSRNKKNTMYELINVFDILLTDRIQTIVVNNYIQHIRKSLPETSITVTFSI